MSGVQYERMLVDVLEELSRTSSPLFEYPATVKNVPNCDLHLLVEEVPGTKVEKRLFRAAKEVYRPFGRVALQLHVDGVENSRILVNQPRWLVPLREELAAVSDSLPQLPEISTNYVVAEHLYRYLFNYGELVPEIRTELSERRMQYWTAKVAEIESAAT
ncbi:MAG: hypothetical protein JWO96_457 [Candidatus Saccharibacteria bacterium]|nr:hypothetical protein [Candidatus Saccharibacteria bacterium]